MSRPKRVMKGLSPEMLPRKPHTAEPALANTAYKPRNRSIGKRELNIVTNAMEAS